MKCRRCRTRLAAGIIRCGACGTPTPAMDRWTRKRNMKYIAPNYEK